MPVTTPAPYLLHDTDILLDVSDRGYVLRVKDLPDYDKPREKMVAAGPSNLTVAELLAIIWGVGSVREDVLTMAQRAVKEYGDKALINENNPKRLAEAAGITLQKACQLLASFELGRRYFAVKSGRSTHIRNSHQAHEYLKDMAFSQKEQLRGLYLGSRHQIVHDEVISVGTLTSNLVHAREVFRPAIEHNAVALIIAHNHPSGSLKPTAADIAVTRQLIQAGKHLGIDLLDHLIIGGNNYGSIMEEIK